MWPISLLQVIRGQVESFSHFTYCFCVHNVCMQYTYHSVYLKVKGYLGEVDAVLLLVHGFQRLSSGRKTCGVIYCTV